MKRRWTAAAMAGAFVCAATLAGCATSSRAGTLPGGVIPVAASISAWGSILQQLGGTHVRATSIISNPATDPHDYEPTVADARTIADSRLFVDNGIGYDSWASKALAASPDSSRLVIDVGKVVRVPAGGNPHQWYSPPTVETIADTITADLKRLDPADAVYFDRQRRSFETTGLAQYHRLISEIRSSYAGTPVGASESIFTPLSDALGLNLITPPGFLQAISEGTDPSAADKATVDAQIADKRIKVYVYNSQNATPDVAAQVAAAKQAGIPISTITETLQPVSVTFQQWQSAQLQALATALAEAAGK